MDPRAPATRAGYATIATAYSEQLSDELSAKPLDRALLSAFAEQTRDTGLVVEVGCGPGQVAAYLASHGVTIEGLDLSPEMIAEATRRRPELAFRVGDMFALPYADASLAGLVAFYAIVHVPAADLVAPFREFRRVVRAGGLIVVSFHRGDGCTHVSEMWGCATSLDFWFHRPDAVIGALEQAGFAIVARLDRVPNPDVEHPSERVYLLAR